MSKAIIPLLCLVMFLSCAKPTDPESLYNAGGYSVVGRLALAGYGEDVKVRDTIAYVAQGEGNLTIVSIADRANPRVLSSYHERLRGAASKVALKDSILYCVEGTSGVDIVNVADPYAAYWCGHFGGSGTTSHDVEVFGQWMFHGLGGVGWQVIDFSYSPIVPDPQSTIEGPGFSMGMAMTADSSLLIACGEMGFAAYDLRDIGRVGGRYDAHMPPYAWVDLPGYAVDVDTMEGRRVAFVACGTAGVQIVDYSDTSNVHVIGSYGTGGYAKEIKYDRGRLYVTTELRGLQILSVQNLSAPVLVGAIHTSFAVGLAVDQHYVYVADEADGLIIVAIPPY